MYYEVEPCGFPMEILPCVNCGQQVGGIDHSMINKEGHLRIVKDINQKKNIESWNRNWYTNCVLLDDFKKENLEYL